MLSAIAARKARQEPEKIHKTPPLDPKPPTPPPPIVRSTPPISKRKPKSQGGFSFKKKKREVRRADERTRYFAEQDVFEQGEDLIVIDQNVSESYSEVSDEEIGQPTLVSLPEPEPVAAKKITKQRAWSPSVALADSSDDESEDGEDGDEPDTQGDAAVFPPPTSAAEHPPVLSTFQPAIDQNTFLLTSNEARALTSVRSDEERTTLLALARAETVALLGTYALTVVRGSVSLYGVTLRASRTSHRVFAPRSSPVPVIRCLETDGGNTVPDPSALTERLRSLFSREVAVIGLREIRTGVEGLGRVCRTFNGVFEPSRWHKSDNEPHLGLSGIHMLTEQSKDIQTFFLPSTWETALSAIVLPDAQDRGQCRRVVGLVKGPKKTGKSTFARTLLNRLLTRYQKVAFLECDLGQSEFTPGGMVALNVIEQPVFGPPFTHPTLPNSAHFIGSTSPRSSPSHYLAVLQSLVETYRVDIQSPIGSDFPGDDRISDIVPLVVNTMGWTKGLGADLSRQIEDMVEPTHIFEVQAPLFEPAWAVTAPSVSRSPEIFTDARPHELTLHRLEPIAPSPLSTNYSPADHRTLAILSYFHAVFPSASSSGLQQISAGSWNTTLPLCARLPYEVDWSLAFDKVILTGSGTEDVVSSEIERVLNCAIVGLVSYDPGTLDIDLDDASTSTPRTIPYTQGTPTPSPSSSNCHGLGFIRATSPTSSHMHILTPLPPPFFGTCRVLVKGELELPIWGMLDFGDVSNGVAGVEKGMVPYMQWGKGEGLGGERRKVRRNLMRKGQM